MNLMMNGMEAMATVDNRPRVLWLSKETDPSGTVIVAIADVGVGLPAGEMERLFEAFFTTKPNDLGVGLAICRSIIKAHGGALWASPNHPCGSVFRFTLPAASSAPPPAPAVTAGHPKPYGTCATKISRKANSEETD